jgi:cytochrome P450
MSDFGFGISTNLLFDSARDFIFPTLHVHEKKIGLYEQLPTLNNLGIGKLIASVLLKVSPQAKRFAEWYESFLNKVVAANATESRGIFGPVIQSGLGRAKSPGHNKAQMIAEGSFSVFSSADAYSITLSGLFHYLSHYPEVYERLAAELRGMYKPGEDIVWDSRLESNVYLRAVINEVMRLLPPACGVHWRECEKSGVFVGPNQVPVTTGSDVGVSVFALCRDARIFRDPLRFWPERWILGTLVEEELATARKMFVPFSIGPRNCAGSHVAVMIASITYAYTLVNYDFRFGPEQQQKVGGGGGGPEHRSPVEEGEDKELKFESHYSIAGWGNGPFIELKVRQ